MVNNYLIPLTLNWKKCKYFEINGYKRVERIRNTSIWNCSKRSSWAEFCIQETWWTNNCYIQISECWWNEFEYQRSFKIYINEFGTSWFMAEVKKEFLLFCRYFNWTISESAWLTLKGTWTMKFEQKKGGLENDKRFSSPSFFLRGEPSFL